jgi:SAM-dependent methyltransferase
MTFARSSYWLTGFSRVWSGEPAADEDAETERWYCDLLRRYVPGPCVRTLDVGCGSGLVMRALAQLCPGAFHVGIDGSDEAVALSARRSIADGVRGAVHCADVTDAGFSHELLARYGRFDLITCFFVLHHYPIDTVARVLGELRDLLAADGAMVLAECHNPDDSRAAATEQVCAQLAKLAGQSADLLLTIPSLQDACLRAGFLPEEICFEVQPGRPFTEREHERNASALERLRANVSGAVQRLGPAKPRELAELDRLVATMVDRGICGPVRHSQALAILRRQVASARPPQSRGAQPFSGTAG